MRNSLVRIAAESLVAVAALPLVLSSCIKDEAPNSEADITGVTLPDSSVLLREPVISNSDITLYADTPDSILAPTFTLTPGATIEPASGTPRKFFTRQMTVSSTDEGKDTTYTFVSTPQQYTVTSQDGQWKKTYTVNVVNNATPADFHFDNVRYYEYNGEPIFQIFYENVAGQNIDWGSGNAGAMVTLMASNPSPADFPTSQADGGVSGKCAKLTTISTGALGTMFGAPIAAGNLFLGSFVVNMQDMPASTHFGIPLRNTAPVSMSGYYKYEPGKTFIRLNDAKNGTVEVPGKTDDFALYAIVYEVTPDAPYIDGNNSLTSPNIVLKAELEAADHKTGDEWVHFDIPFVQQNGKTIDRQKLLDGKYNIAIIMSSSEGGARFDGAIGSTLFVDEIHIKYE